MRALEARIDYEFQLCSHESDFRVLVRSFLLAASASFKDGTTFSKISHTSKYLVGTFLDLASLYGQSSYHL